MGRGAGLLDQYCVCMPLHGLENTGCQAGLGGRRATADVRADIGVGTICVAVANVSVSLRDC